MWRTQRHSLRGRNSCSEASRFPHVRAKASSLLKPSECLSPRQVVRGAHFWSLVLPALFVCSPTETLLLKKPASSYWPNVERVVLLFLMTLHHHDCPHGTAQDTGARRGAATRRGSQAGWKEGCESHLLRSVVLNPRPRNLTQRS